MKAVKLKKCRVCSNEHLEKVLDLGNQELTGVFPDNVDNKVTEGPLRLVFCDVCGLLQLDHSYSLDEMYGMNYGYRSGLNVSMVNHLRNKAIFLQNKYSLNQGDIVVDIGSNDGTTLNSYSCKGLIKIGFDPTGVKFKKFYNEDINLIPNFFSSDAYFRITDKPAKVVTSLSMFYDLEAPIDFAKQVEKILSIDGVWHLEQSYMPTMLRQNSYDTVCHEHLEYYSLSVIKYIVEASGMRIIDVGTNDVNGGSFCVTVAKEKSKYKSNEEIIQWMLNCEIRQELMTKKPYLEFARNVYVQKDNFLCLLDSLSKSGKKIFGYGASTKGNVILQYCGISTKQMKTIVEVNCDKFGKYTPKTHIPIVSEEIIKQEKPDYLVVLPWHFRNMILKKEHEYLTTGGKIIFPLPYTEVV